MFSLLLLGNYMTIIQFLMKLSCLDLLFDVRFRIDYYFVVINQLKALNLPN